MFSKEGYWANRKAGKRGQGEQPNLTKMATPNLSIGRKRERAQQFSKFGRHLTNGSSRGANGRFVSPLNDRYLTPKEHGSLMNRIFGPKKEQEKK